MISVVMWSLDQNDNETQIEIKDIYGAFPHTSTCVFLWIIWGEHEDSQYCVYLLDPSQANLYGVTHLIYLFKFILSRFIYLFLYLILFYLIYFIFYFI